MERINFTEEQGFAIRELQISSYRRGLVTGIVYSVLSLIGIYFSVITIAELMAI